LQTHFRGVPETAEIKVVCRPFMEFARELPEQINSDLFVTGQEGDF